MFPENKVMAGEVIPPYIREGYEKNVLLICRNTPIGLDHIYGVIEEGREAGALLVDGRWNLCMIIE